MDTLRHLFGDSRPVDVVMLVIEFLVLLIIAIEAVGSYRHKKRIAKKEAVVSKLMSAAYQLQINAAARHTPPETQTNWVKAVEKWESDTEAYLKSCSAQAVTAFKQDIGTVNVWVPNTVANGVVYSALAKRMLSLKTILENPEVYLS